VTPATVSDLSCKLLRDAAAFFVSVGEQNPRLSAEMTGNAEVYRQVADILEVDPGHRLDNEDGTPSGASLSDVAAKMLDDAATFFLNVGVQNPALGGQMDDSAGVFRTVAELLKSDPGHRLPLN
jgi:hypothetical protein